MEPNPNPKMNAMLAQLADGNVPNDAAHREQLCQHGHCKIGSGPIVGQYSRAVFIILDRVSIKFVTVKSQPREIWIVTCSIYIQAHLSHSSDFILACTVPQPMLVQREVQVVHAYRLLDELTLLT